MLSSLRTTVVVPLMQLHACGELTLARGQVPTKAALSLPLLSRTGERKYNKRLMGRDTARGRSLTSDTYRLDLGKKFITNQIRAG